MQLAEHFHGNRALARNHIRVVKGVDKGHALLFLQLDRVLVGVRIAVTCQHHFTAQRSHGIHLHLGRGRRHHDHGTAAQLFRPQRHTLRMVACRGTDHALGQLLLREIGHLVVGPAQLEAEHRLLVFTLEQNLVVQAAAQIPGGFQIRLNRHVVHACIQDFCQVIKGRECLFLCHTATKQAVSSERVRRHAKETIIGTHRRANHHRVATPPSSAQKKAPSRWGLGLNPPLEEVEETTGALQS